MTRSRHSNRACTPWLKYWPALLLLPFVWHLQGAEPVTRVVTAPSMGNTPTQRFVTITAEFEQFEFPSGDI
jgi:hypothetical protein